MILCRVPPDRSVGHNQNIEPGEGSRIVEQRPLNPPQGGGRVHPAPQPNPFGNAPSGGPSGSGFLVPVGPPIIHPVGPVAPPIDVESSNISE